MAQNVILLIFDDGHFENGSKINFCNGISPETFFYVEKYHKCFIKKLVLEDHGGVQAQVLYMSD